jgi:hypothetical protein
MTPFFHKFCLLTGIILLIILANTSVAKQAEPFTPFIRQTYRPHLRNARRFAENTIQTVTLNLTTLFRKFGLM